MAVKYRKGGGNWDAANSWTTTDGGTDYVATPTSVDDVRFWTGVGAGDNVAVNVTASCKSYDFGTWAGTLSGSGQMRVANGIFYFSASMTLTWTGQLRCITAATVLLTTNGFTLNTVQAYLGATLSLQDALICNDISLGLVSNGAATLTTNDNNVTCTSTIVSANPTGTSVFNLGSSQITCTAFTLSASAATTVNRGTSKITITGNGTTLWGYGATSYYDVEFTGTGTHTIANRTSGTVTFNDLIRTCGANHTDILSLATPVIVENEFKIIGNSAVYRTFVYSSVYGTAQTLDLTGATIGNCAYVDFRDIAFSGSPDFTTANAGGEIVGGSGDCLGNTGVTLTTGVNLYWGVDTGSVSDVSKWWLEVAHTNHRNVGGIDIRPLPQDNTLYNDASFSGNGRTITIDVPRFCNNFICSNTTRTTEIYALSIYTVIYGNLTMASGTSGFSTANQYTTFAGRGNHTITTAGKGWTGTGSGSGIIFNCLTGTYTLQDDLDSINKIYVTSGTFDDGGNDIALILGGSAILSTGTGIRTIIKGGVWTWSTTPTVTTVWDFTDPTNLTFTDSGTTVFNQTSASTKTIQSGGKTFNNLTFNNGSSSPIVIAGSPTINGVLTIAAGTKSIRLTAGTTLTLGASSSIVNGSTVANPCTIESATASSTAYISKQVGVIDVDKLVITDITFLPFAFTGLSSVLTRVTNAMATFANHFMAG